MVDLTYTPARPQPGPGHRTVVEVAEGVAHVVGSALDCEAVGIVLHATDEDASVVVATTTAARSAAAAPAEPGVVTIPLGTRDRELGVLRLHLRPTLDHDAPDPTPVDPALTGDVAALVAVALDVARDRDELRRALDTRGEIGVAMGILVERYGLAPDAAFQVLVRHSQYENRKLRDIAHTLVEDGRLPGLDTGEGPRDSGPDARLEG